MRNHHTWPVISTAAPSKLRKLVGAGRNQGELARAVVEHQLENFKNAQKAASKISGEPLGELRGVNFDNTKVKGQMGENPAEDGVALLTMAKAQGVTNLAKDLWNWERLPYSIRCACIAKVAGDSDASTPAEPPRKKKRTEGDEELHSDPDDWWVVWHVICDCPEIITGFSITRFVFVL